MKLRNLQIPLKNPRNGFHHSLESFDFNPAELNEVIEFCTGSFGEGTRCQYGHKPPANHNWFYDTHEGEFREILLMGFRNENDALLFKMRFSN